MTENHSAQIGGNADHSAIITGDRNTASITITNYYYDKTTLAPVESTVADSENIPCPYRGLFHFSPDDADYFFGREVFVKELFAATQTRNFIPVLGASGSGKSSVVLAGLVPKLQKEGYWKFTHFRPGADPFHALALALVPLYVPDKNSTEQMYQARQLAEYFVNGSILLQDVLTQIARNYPNHRVLLIADQFEELYTLCGDQEVRHNFLDTLLASFQSSPSQKQSSSVLVSTIRADFLGNTLSYRPFADVLQNADIKLGSMNYEELTEVIEKPAKKLGVAFEVGLVERILDDIEDEPGNLPLLEFALTQLWKRRNGKLLTHAAYGEIGEVKGALARHADENYDKLSATQKEQVRRIFIQLVRPGEGKEDTRRLATKAELGEASWELVKQLADERLVVTNQNAANQETVEVVHEALICNWGKFGEWMNTDRSFRAWQERLRGAMYQWEQMQRDEGALLRGAALALAEENLKQRHEDISEREQEFIQASAKLRDLLLKREEEDRKRQIFVTSITSVFLAGFAIFAGYQWRQAEIGQIQALKQSSKANFTVNRNSFEALIDVLRAGKHLQKFPLGISDQQVQADVLTNLAQSVNWVREQNRLQGHQNAILSVSFSPDGKAIATASYDNTVKLWRRDGSFLKTLGHTKEVLSVSFSPDGKTIASGSLDGKVRLWDSNGNLKQVIPAHNKWVMSVSFSQDGKMIATASDDNTAKVWRLDGQLLSTLKGHQHWVRQASFSPKGDKIITVSDDKTAKLWSIDGNVLPTTLDKHSDVVTSADFSDNGLIATSSVDKTVKLWDKDGKLLNTLEHSGQVWSVSVSNDGQTIASGSDDGTVRLWAPDGRLLDRWLSHEGQISSIAFSADGKILATAGNDGIAKLWQVNRSWLSVLVGHRDNVLDAKFSHDGKRIASASFDGTVSIWSPEGKLSSILKGHKGIVNAVNFSPDGKTIVSGGDDYTIKLWNVDTQAQKTLGQHKDRIVFVSFSKDGQTIASASADGTAKLWSLDGKELKTLKGHKGAALIVAISPDKHTIATAGDDNTVKLWNYNGQKLKEWKAHTSELWSIDFSSDGKTIITASGDKSIKLWRRDGTLIKTLNGHEATVLNASFSPNGKMIASASSDGTIKLWRRDGTLITTLNGHTNKVHTVSFSHDSKWLISASADKLILLWDVSDMSLKGLVEKGCSQVSNYLKTQANSLKQLCN